MSSINFRQETPLDSTTSGDEDEVEASTTNSIQDESDYLSNPSDAALAASATLYIPPEDVAQYLDLDSARETAINDRKWVLVNIQQLHDFDSMLLNRDFWTNKEIKKIIQESFVFLQVRFFLFLSSYSCRFNITFSCIITLLAEENLHNSIHVVNTHISQYWNLGLESVSRFGQISLVLIHLLTT